MNVVTIIFLSLSPKYHPPPFPLTTLHLPCQTLSYFHIFSLVWSTMFHPVCDDLGMWPDTCSTSILDQWIYHWGKASSFTSPSALVLISLRKVWSFLISFWCYGEMLIRKFPCSCFVSIFICHEILYITTMSCPGANAWPTTFSLQARIVLLPLSFNSLSLGVGMGEVYLSYLGTSSPQTLSAFTFSLDFFSCWSGYKILQILNGLLQSLLFFLPCDFVPCKVFSIVEVTLLSLSLNLPQDAKCDQKLFLMHLCGKKARANLEVMLRFQGLVIPKPTYW